MSWEVLFSDECETWFFSLTKAEQEDVLAVIELLEAKGHNLGRPYVDTVCSKKVSNLKELRVQHAGKPYRIFFAFDPNRSALLLCGGRKDGSKNKQFYKVMIAIAERELIHHLNMINNQ